MYLLDLWTSVMHFDIFMTFFAKIFDLYLWRRVWRRVWRRLWRRLSQMLSKWKKGQKMSLTVSKITMIIILESFTACPRLKHCVKNWLRACKLGENGAYVVCNYCSNRVKPKNAISSFGSQSIFKLFAILWHPSGTKISLRVTFQVWPSILAIVYTKRP